MSMLFVAYPSPMSCIVSFVLGRTRRNVFISRQTCSTAAMCSVVMPAASFNTDIGLDRGVKRWMLAPARQEDGRRVRQESTLFGSLHQDESWLSTIGCFSRYGPSGHGGPA